MRERLPRAPQRLRLGVLDLEFDECDFAEIRRNEVKRRRAHLNARSYPPSRSTAAMLARPWMLGSTCATTISSARSDCACSTIVTSIEREVAPQLRSRVGHHLDRDHASIGADATRQV